MELPYSESLVNDLKELPTYKQRYEVLISLENFICNGIKPVFKDSDVKRIYERNEKEIKRLADNYRQDF